MLLQSNNGDKLAKADLHVHSEYSEHPSEWFLQRLGAKESYTDPETIYRMARERGMDFVTITDHNRIEGSLILREKYPDNTFTGVEFTTYFPEDNCKIHILVYGLDKNEFLEIQLIRSNIYQLWHYLNKKKLVHSVAHATYPVNGLLKMEHLEKLILMFDLFEGLNGGRNKVNNWTWIDVLANLDEQSIEDLKRKHPIKPYSNTPWLKAITGGSDDHAGLFIGQTFTETAASTPEEFIQALGRKSTIASGRSNDYQSLVFAVYKIAFEFSRQKRRSATRNLAGALTEFIFEQKEFKLKEKLFLKKFSAPGRDRSTIYGIINNLIKDIRAHSNCPLEERLGIVYERIADLSDEFIRSLVVSIKKDIADGDLVGLITNSSASIPGVFLSLPFFSAVRDMFKNKSLLNDLDCRFGEGEELSRNRKVMWFTDTFTDLNGVSVTLRKVAGIACSASPGVRIVTALTDEEKGQLPVDNVVCLPFIDSFNLPGYEKYLMKVPSVLKTLDIIAEYEPDEIYISTPGPVGLCGLLIAKLMGIRATGFFHTDYARQATKIVLDESVNDIIEGYIKWFYSCFNEVRVPTDEYIRILVERGYDLKKMIKFRRGIDTSEFFPAGEPRVFELIEKEPVLLYTGRISREKDLDIALQAYRNILPEYPSASFFLAGDGPYLQELKQRCSDLSGVHFTGRLPNSDLPDFYSGADVFVFPSDSDTFGMSVLEAQACGLPAVVSSVGGPKEIIEDGRTGFTARVGDVDDWTEKLLKVLNFKYNDENSYMKMRRDSRTRVLLHYDWEIVYDSLFSTVRAEAKEEKEMELVNLVTGL
ncbi:MAG: glycosyltransferase [Candidatus Sabulitectum sp.]|nr:glycosyltransferase [Candidatus Sabulitectum sp.]